MESKPLTSEAIALTEKKMEMSLEDIIKMSKKNYSKGKKPPRIPIKNQGFLRRGPSQMKSSKVQNFLESRSSIRQGALARRRTSMAENQFPLTTEVARKAMTMPARNMVVNMNKTRVAPVKKAGDDKVIGKSTMPPKHRQTLDARFASIREQKILTSVSQQPLHGGANQNAPRGRGQQQQQQWQPRGWGAPARTGPGRRFGNFRR